MANPCKVCSDANLKAQVNALIAEGISDENVSRAVASIGIAISKSAILRHRMNHAPADGVTPVEMPEGMQLPPRLDPASPLETEATALLAKAGLGKTEIDVARDQLTKETLLSQIFETHLAVTAVALDRYQKGEGRYPLDMVKGLATIGALFEKTSMQVSSRGFTTSTLLEMEFERRETAAREEARRRAIAGENPSFYMSEHRLSIDGGVHFGTKFLSATDVNERVETAWNDGIRIGKAERKASAKLRETPKSIETVSPDESETLPGS